MAPVGILINWQMNRVKWRPRVVHEFGSLYTTSSYCRPSRNYGSPSATGSSFTLVKMMASIAIMDRVKAEGYKAIVLTADATVVVRSISVMVLFFPVGMPLLKNTCQKVLVTNGLCLQSAKQRLSPRDVESIAEYSGLPVYVKGPQCREDVERLLAAGASGIWVTNHGGRQIDGGPAFDSLQEVAEAADERVPIVLTWYSSRPTRLVKALGFRSRLSYWPPALSMAWPRR